MTPSFFYIKNILAKFINRKHDTMEVIEYDAKRGHGHIEANGE